MQYTLFRLLNRYSVAATLLLDLQYTLFRLVDRYSVAATLLAIQFISIGRSLFSSCYTDNNTTLNTYYIVIYIVI